MKPTETLKELTIAFVFIFLASLACDWAIVVVDERKQRFIGQTTVNETNKLFILTDKEYEIYLKAKAEAKYEK